MISFSTELQSGRKQLTALHFSTDRNKLQLLLLIVRLSMAVVFLSGVQHTQNESILRGETGHKSPEAHAQITDGRGQPLN